MEQKLSKFEERKRTLEEEVGTRKTQIIENEMFKQQHENEIRRLEAEIKEKTETLNSVIGKEVNTDTNTVGTLFNSSAKRSAKGCEYGYKYLHLGLIKCSFT